MALEQHLPKSEMLFFGQDKTDALYVIASGSVQLIDESQGYEQSLTVFSRHDFIGETILVAPVHPQISSARAYTDVTLYRFDRDNPLSFLEKRGDLALKTRLSFHCWQFLLLRIESPQF